MKSRSQAEPESEKSKDYTSLVPPVLLKRCASYSDETS